MVTVRIVIDFIIGLVTAAFGVRVALKKQFAEAIPYYTVQSNLYCALVSTVCASPSMLPIKFTGADFNSWCAS